MPFIASFLFTDSKVFTDKYRTEVFLHRPTLGKICDEPTKVW